MQENVRNSGLKALGRRQFVGAALASVLLPTAAAAEGTEPAAVRLNALGPENEPLSHRVGLWDVIQTHWASPGAAPVATRGLVAERRMIGSLLQETMRPASDKTGLDIARIDYLTFNRVEGRWDYVSLDMRDPVGIMPAWSFTRGENGRIELTFQPFAFAGAGSDVSGQMLRMTQVNMLQGPDRDTKEQTFLMADGVGTPWLATRYAYTRRS